MTAESAMLAGRRAAEAKMTDTADVYGLPVRSWDEATLKYVTGSPVVVYSGPCEIKLADVQVLEVEQQGQELGVQRAIVKFPVDADTVFAEGFTIKITASPTDEANVGRTFRVTSPHAQSYATARRYPVESVL
jgi:hypothetical protein